MKKKSCQHAGQNFVASAVEELLVTEEEMAEFRVMMMTNDPAFFSLAPQRAMARTIAAALYMDVTVRHSLFFQGGSMCDRNLELETNYALNETNLYLCSLVFLTSSPSFVGNAMSL